MSYSLEFDVEPFEMQSPQHTKRSGKGGGVCRACAQREEAKESEFGLGGIARTVGRAAKKAGAVAADVLSGKDPFIIDLTAKADKSNRRGTRELARDRWDEMEGEFEFESDHEEGEATRRRSMASRTVAKSPTRSSTRPGQQSGQQRKGQNRSPGRRSRFAQRGGLLAANTAPCICPQHGSEFVRWLQSSLNQVLSLRLPVNGLIDAATRSAIRSFQEQRSLPVDGIAGPETKRALIEAKSGEAKDADGDAADAAPTANEILEFEDAEWEGEVNRSSSEYVKWLQTALNRIIGAQLTVDGISGTYTRSAVRSFQSKQGLTADGIAGPLTEEALIRAGAGTPPGYGAPSTSPSPPTTVPGGAPTFKPSFIFIQSDVRLNPVLETAVRGLDAHFKKANLRVTLTSAVRTPESQLSIIRSEAIKRGIHKKYPSIRTATVDNIESWRGAWDELLNREGFIVNPPKTTTSRINGRQYSPSPHIAGTALDLSGADLDRIADVVRGYCQEGGSISQILIERKNNAVHVGVAGRGSCGISQ